MIVGMDGRPEVPRGRGALLGIVTAGVALGVGHLVAGVVATGASPLVAVGQAAIDLAPPWLKEFAIDTFGANDKKVLFAGMVLVVTALAAVLGSRRGAAAPRRVRGDRRARGDRSGRRGHARRRRPSVGAPQPGRGRRRRARLRPPPRCAPRIVATPDARGRALGDGRPPRVLPLRRRWDRGRDGGRRPGVLPDPSHRRHRVSRGGRGPGPREPRDRRRRHGGRRGWHRALLHPERPLLQGGHDVRDALGGGRGLDAPGPWHGGRPDDAHLRRPAGAADDRARPDAGVRLEPGGGRVRRQRPVDRDAARAAAGGGGHRPRRRPARSPARSTAGPVGRRCRS